MSNTWRENYLSALKIRDAREKANADIYEAYTKLADHAASLAAANQQQPSTPEPAPAQPPSAPHKIPPPILSATPAPAPAPTPTPNDLTRLRTDLSAAQKSKSALTTHLSALQSAHAALEATHARTAAALAAVARDKAVLERRLKDRDAELREKRALLERVQDEVVGLEMQVNVAEEGKRALREENEGLVRRLVGEREEVVERVNRESGWGA